MNFTVAEKESVTIVFTLEEFRLYLLGSKITIFTDHPALRYLIF